MVGIVEIVRAVRGGEGGDGRAGLLRRLRRPPDVETCSGINCDYLILLLSCNYITIG